MSVAPLHRLYNHYSELPLSMRILYTGALCILGMGYLFAIIYLVHTYSGRDGKPGISEEDLVVAYAGSGKGSKLEAALRGPMSTMLPAEEANALVKWAQKGADRADLRKLHPPGHRQTLHDVPRRQQPAPAELQRLRQHQESDRAGHRNRHLHPGARFAHSPVRNDVHFLHRWPHFTHAYVRPVWLKCLIMALPLVCIAIDISSWYLVKIYHPFAWATMAAGGVQGLSFATMWFISMYQMWIGKTPKAILQRYESQGEVIG